MPLTGDTFSYTPGTAPGPSGTAISSTKRAQRDADVLAAFNTSQSIARGGTGATTDIGAHDNIVTSGGDIASASTINLTTATGASVDITGTTTITAVTLSEGMQRYARCVAALPITASSSLIVDGATTGTTTYTAGDVFRFEGDASSVVRVWKIGGANSPVWEKGDNVESATTISLGAGNLFHITGTTTITDIDYATPVDGRISTLVFDGILTLTHHATTLVLPGGENITTAAGDTCEIVQDSGDSILVTTYVRKSGDIAANSYTNADGTNSVAADVLLSGAPKAWLNMNGTGTISIRESLNVSSLVDNGVGLYTQSFTNDFDNADYSPQVTGSGAISINAAGNAWFALVAASAGGGAPTSKTIGELRIGAAQHNSSAVDAPDIYSAILGELA